MLQRPINFYQSLDEDDLKAVNDWLKTCGGEASMKTQIATQIIRKNNLLYPAKDT